MGANQWRRDYAHLADHYVTRVWQTTTSREAAALRVKKALLAHGVAAVGEP
jgi:hypothetical protein